MIEVSYPEVAAKTKKVGKGMKLFGKGSQRKEKAETKASFFGEEEKEKSYCLFY